tara:strand:- start:1437 stop:2555 length:1119 start_codon:yes stop_codon:yes gene_type:complete
MKIYIPVNEPKFTPDDKKNLMECIDSGWVSSGGKYLTSFENKMSTVFRRKYVSTVTNGTAALDLAIKSIGIKKNDEILMPSFAIISIVLEVLRVGAKPIFIDSDPLTWNMNVSDLKKKITSKTKAIIAVHTYGLPVDMDPIIKFAKKNKIKIIEDAAEVIGQNYKGRPCGSFGDISTFSFYANKQITTGEGGAILTNRLNYYKKFKYFRNLCFEKKRFIHRDIGWNLRMTNMQASIGVSQLNRLSKIIKKKIDIGKRYNKNLESIDNFLQLPLAKTSYAVNIYWVYGVVLKKNSKYTALQVINYLKKKGIECRPFFYPLHLQPVVQKLIGKTKTKYPVAERLSKYGFYLPSGLALKNKQIDYVSKKLKELFI